MLKSYNELRKIDITKFCEDRDGIKYLNWAKCVDLLHEYGAEHVSWVPVPNMKTGGSLYCSEYEFQDKNGNKNRCYETSVMYR